MAVSIDGDVFIVGAVSDDDACPQDVDCNSGSAYIFARKPGGWFQQIKLVAPDPKPRVYFGTAVAINGSYAAIGTSIAGSVYLFERVGDDWTSAVLQQQISGSHGFGRSIALEGDRLVVGTPDSHYVTVFNHDGSMWTTEATLTPSDAGGSFSYFGSDLDLDGDKLVIGRPMDDEGCPQDVNCNSGSAYVFEWKGDQWIEAVKITASDAEPDGRFGRQVSISGNTIVVGSNDSFYVFENGPDGWYERQKLITTSKEVLNGSGVSVDGDQLVVSGDEVYFFHRVESDWVEVAHLRPGDNLYFTGNSVDVDGNHAVVGASGFDILVPFTVSTGAAYVFAFDGVDCNANGVPDQCEPDCNNDGVPDACAAFCEMDCECGDDDVCRLDQCVNGTCQNGPRQYGDTPATAPSTCSTCSV